MAKALTKIIDAEEFDSIGIDDIDECARNMSEEVTNDLKFIMYYAANHGFKKNNIFDIFVLYDKLNNKINFYVKLKHKNKEIMIINQYPKMIN